VTFSLVSKELPARAQGISPRVVPQIIRFELNNHVETATERANGDKQ
jgi:hypothetical protein